MHTRPDGRRSIRLRGYDYSQAGAYFVTICAQDRACVFGSVADGKMCLNAAGRLVRRVWDEIPRFYAGVRVDVCVVMPNHVHGIIILTGGVRNGLDDGPAGCGRDVGAAPCGRLSSSGLGQARGPAPTDAADAETVDEGRGVVAQTGRPMTLGDVMHRFKTMTTRLYADGVHQAQWPPFRHRLWQRNYYEHVIRDAGALQRIRTYIEQNPLRWRTDAQNPGREASVDNGRIDSASG